MLNNIAALFSGAGGGGGSFESIATATGTGSSNTISFTSIPSTYQHLQIRCISHATSNTNLIGRITFNSDSGSNYARHRLVGDGTSVSATGQASTTSIEAIDLFGDGLNSDKYGVAIVDIHDYAATTKYKTLRSFSGKNDNTTTTDSQVRLYSGLWMSTSAITSITITANATLGYFNTSSTFALYGIKGA